jgi:raffinose/stachyose/melibiose transport system substrate-binding protein
VFNNSPVRARASAAVVGLMAVAALVIAGCGGSSNSAGNTSSSASSASSSGKATGTIRLLAHSAIQAPLEGIIKNFEAANPGVKVNAQFLPPGNPFLQGLTTQVQGGNAPDVFYTNGGSSSNGPVSVLPLAKAGKIADLSGSSWAGDVPSAARNLFYSGGKLFALPLFEAPLAVEYNATEFKKLGLKPPTTYAEMLQLCGKIKAAGKVPLSVPGQAAVILPLELAANTVYASAPNWDAQRSANKTTFAGTKGWQTAMQRVVDMNKAGCFQPGAAGATVPAAVGDVSSGKALMFAGPVDALGFIEGGAKGKFQFAAFPFPGDTPNSTMAMVSYSPSLVVSNASKNQATAKKFIDFAASPAQSAAAAKAGGTISLQQAKNGNLPAALSSFAPLFKANKTVGYAPDAWASGGPLNTAMIPGMSALLTGQKTPTQVLQSMDQQWGK